MKTVVVGGHTRNVGKTSVTAGLIAGLKSLGWTAVKITQHRHSSRPSDGGYGENKLERRPFVLSEETDPRGRGDTCRFLAAGARRALWLRARGECLREALPELWKALGSDEHVILESNSILEFFRPTLYLVVLDASRQDFKSSARRFLAQADAFVSVGSPLEAPAWPCLETQVFRGKPILSVSRQTYASRALLQFVQDRLAEAIPGAPRPAKERASSWPH